MIKHGNQISALLTTRTRVGWGGGGFGGGYQFEVICLFSSFSHQFLIILGRFPFYTLLCLQYEPTCMRIKKVQVGNDQEPV